MSDEEYYSELEADYEGADDEPTDTVSETDVDSQAKSGRAKKDETKGEVKLADVKSTNADLDESSESGESEDESVATNEDDFDDDIVATAADYDQDAHGVESPDEPEYTITESEYVREIVVVRPENRLTSNILSSFETTDIISIRATQIAQFNNCMIETVGIDDPIKMAEMELMARKCPLVLVREVGSVRQPNGQVQQYVEHWSPNHMTFSQTFG